jgi:hypothetical protein
MYRYSAWQRSTDLQHDISTKKEFTP